MDPFSIMLLSVGLAMDSFTVSICGGMTMNPLRWRYAVRIAFFFGLFQALMPVLGWLGGLAFRNLISSYDHWIAFALLALIGGKMIHESRQGDACDRTIDVASIGMLLVLSVATSIDALAVGLSLSFLNVPIAAPVISIGVVTAALCLVGVWIGRRCGSLFHSHALLVGGIILVGIGLRILVSHLTATPVVTSIGL